MTWVGVNTFQKFQLRQLRQWVFFGAIWPLHLGTIRKLHTKHWFDLSSSMQHLFGIPIINLRLDRWRRCRGQLPGGPAGDGGTPVASATKTMGFLRRNLALAPRHTKEVAFKALVRSQLEYAAPIWSPYRKLQIQEVEKVQRTAAARWTCRRWRNTSSVGDILDELEWPSLEARREQSSLTFFYKIHSGTVSLDKDKYLTPAPNLQRTRASHDSHYTRYFACSDALKNSFFPRTIPLWNSLPSSVVSSKTTEEFKGLI